MIGLANLIIRTAIFLAIILLLAPSGASKKYIGIISGFILLIAILGARDYIKFELPDIDTSGVEEKRLEYLNQFESGLEYEITDKINLTAKELIAKKYPDSKIFVTVYREEDKFFVQLSQRIANIWDFEAELERELGVPLEVVVLADAE